MLHKDKKLNRLYTQIAKIYEEEGVFADAMMPLLDKIAARREELGEM